MKFLADMGISQKTVFWLRNKGHDAIHLRERNLQRLPDPLILKKAREEGRVILTCDLDFAALLAASNDQLPSVVLFRLDDERPDNINERLAAVLNQSMEALDRGAIVSVEEKRYRVRFLPIK